MKRGRERAHCKVDTGPPSLSLFLPLSLLGMRRSLSLSLSLSPSLSPADADADADAAADVGRRAGHVWLCGRIPPPTHWNPSSGRLDPHHARVSPILSYLLCSALLRHALPRSATLYSVPPPVRQLTRHLATGKRRCIACSTVDCLRESVVRAVCQTGGRTSVRAECRVEGRGTTRERERYGIG